MRKLLNTMQRFCKDENGAALAEYAVLLGILVAAVITAITTLGTDITAKFTAVSGIINGTAASGT
jgi:pilus assembly protein Flp/PilA